ncbi:MAG: carbohydrate ABC transporter permease [Mycobacteriales bacterium]
MVDTLVRPVVAPPRARISSRQTKAARKTWLINGILIGIGSLFFIPMLWMLLASINSTAGLSVSWPARPTLGNFRAVMNEDTSYRPIRNGLVICGFATSITLVCAVLAAYPLSRYRTRYRKPYLYTILFTTGLPITALMVPVYGLFVQVNLVDTTLGAILFLATAGLPFGIWLMKNFVDGVPVQLEEAAWTDGASNMQALRYIVLPLMRPGMAVVAMFSFVGMWGNFFVPFVLLLSPDKMPASVTIYTFFGQYGEVAYGQLAAYSMLYAAPAVLLYLFLSRKLGGAFTLGGAVKG